LINGYPTNEEIAKVVETISQKDLLETIETRLIGDKRRECAIYLDSTRDGAALPAIPAADNEVPSLEEYWKRAK
jgi:hypothetical protein